MKKIFILKIMLLFSILAFSQAERFKSTHIIEDMFINVKTLEEKDSYVIFTQTDIIHKNSPKTVNIKLYDNWSYDIFIFCDSIIKKIKVDIFRLTEDGKTILVKNASSNQNYITIRVKPKYIDNYMLAITATETIHRVNVGHYGILIFHE